MTNDKHVLTYLWWYVAMQVILALFVHILKYPSLRFLLKPWHSGGERKFIYGAMVMVGIEKLYKFIEL